MSLLHDKKHSNTYPYDLFLSDYIRQRVYPDDRTMLEESLELDNVMNVLSGQSEYKGELPDKMTGMVSITISSALSKTKTPVSLFWDF